MPVTGWSRVSIINIIKYHIIKKGENFTNEWQRKIFVIVNIYYLVWFSCQEIQRLLIFQSVIVNAAYRITESTESRPNVYECWSVFESCKIFIKVRSFVKTEKCNMQLKALKIVKIKCQQSALTLIRPSFGYDAFGFEHCKPCGLPRTEAYNS